MWLVEMSDNTVKAHRKRLRRDLRREVNGHKHSIVGMIIFVPCGIVATSIEPFSYGGHRSGKLSGAYPDRDTAHAPSPAVSQM
jgi:hypothetical protein